MYINSYLENVGKFINMCMDYVKDKSGLDRIQKFADQLRDPDAIEDMFIKDVKEIRSEFKKNNISDEEARENFTRLRVYTLAQLEQHFELINDLLKDTENRTGTSIRRDDGELPVKLKEDILKIIDDTEKEVVGQSS